MIKYSLYLKPVIPTPPTEFNHMLASIRSLKIVKRSGGELGAWFQAGDQGGDHSPIYFLPGAQGTSLLRYPSLPIFAAANLGDAHNSEAMLTLPTPYQGTGHALLGNYLYYHRADSDNEIVKVGVALLAPHTCFAMSVSVT